MKSLKKGIQLVILMTALTLTGAAVAAVVNVNTADAQTIANNLNGIGLSKAQAIVAWRETNGQFADLEDLQQVKGIGEKTLEKNKQDIEF